MKKMVCFVLIVDSNELSLKLSKNMLNSKKHCLII
uniref:Uncharacterized protein n=1 Tax=Siphoviridae sp. ctLqe90 TaxID=2825456 RepID=A0A8S5Q2D4_9CAUD|nr:MAG TPA: hypothetical protein [Siphoviridae sp. ctLqe90]DAH29736.1 MAG TPA: hypothetical protein [Caudoviricetes sp.]